MADYWKAEKENTERKVGCAVFGWVVFLVLLAGIGLFGYRTWSYYGKIRSGDLIDLPQFGGKLTRTGTGSGSSQNLVERSVVEDKDSPQLGPDDAVLTIVEFADFECPYSKEVSSAARRVMAKHADKVKLIYRDYPIALLHPNAFQAAMAAECAREQGKFWPYHDKLYANSPSLGYADLLRYGGEIGLDQKQFEKCLVDSR